MFKNKYERLKYDLETKGFGKMKCFGSSMLPILSKAGLCEYEVREEYNVGDIVFCKVNGRWIDAHLITKKDIDGKGIRYLISNNHGFDNGWTRKIFGKVIKAIDDTGKIKTFS